MKKILIVSVNIVNNSPQPIRLRNLINIWKNSHKITLLTKDNPGTDQVFDKQVEIDKLPYSFWGKLLIKQSLTASGKKKVGKQKNKKIFTLIRKIWRKSNLQMFIFPDKYLFELKSFRKKLKELILVEEYDVVIISAYPFSLLRLAKQVKFYQRDLKPVCIYDTGDPFFGNSVKHMIAPLHNYFSKNYEKRNLKYIDDLVVISQVVKEHYEKNYPVSLRDKKVMVIEQGIRKMIVPVNIDQSGQKDGMKLMYAGGFYRKLREPFNLYKAIDAIQDIPIHLKIFGNIYEKFLPDLKQGKYSFGGSINQQQVIEEYMISNLIVFIDNAFGIQVPGKILEIISLCKPILFIYENDNSPTLEFIRGYRGVVFVKNNQSEIERAIRNIYNKEIDFDFAYDLTPYYWDSLSKKYEQLF